ncbi:hypothetical protein ASPWEDRAFT_69291 [Aspergillus wentii DTO 134E9]|uniref:Uncharacterized protein n=1 Tax=Aspergillus wentii DTO 134E9 TaxID=1073089 RepID=A0A1L9RMD9_ASPWE|nr:uncharacterized protein ASPWEDRAFT_69291 [Aspergillus wentii DTO 134E9]OJJ36064.1 hypothetical protein ASPWEDRAFT_69291 [Aspergillus wentii DTO 134E9]
MSRVNNEAPAVPSHDGLDPRSIVNFFNQLRAISSEAGLRSITTVHGENAKLYDQLKGKDEEISKLKKEMRTQDERKWTAMEEMFSANEREKDLHKATQKQLQALEKTQADKDKVIYERNGKIKALEKELQQLQSDYAKESSDLKKANTEINTLHQTIKERDTTVEKMKTAGSDLKEKLSAAKKRAKELEEGTASAQQALEKVQARLTRVEGFAGELIEHDEETLIDGFVGLWDFAKDELSSHFSVDLPQDSLQQTNASWNRLRKCDLALEHHIPLPCSNTQAAKRMRLAMVLALLAREIDRNIFQPTEMVSGNSQIRKCLVDLATVDGEKESFYRAISHSIDPPAQMGMREANVSNAVNSVAAYMDGLFTDELRTKFRQSLEKIVRQAVQVWQPIQRGRRKYESDFERPLTEEDEWYPLVFSGTGPKDPKKGRLDKKALIVFPRIWMVENGVMATFTVVTQLEKSQPDFQSAAVEMEQMEERLRSGTGRVVSRNRRANSHMTTNQSNGGRSKERK